MNDGKRTTYRGILRVGEGEYQVRVTYQFPEGGQRERKLRVKGTLIEAVRAPTRTRFGSSRQMAPLRIPSQNRAQARLGRNRRGGVGRRRGGSVGSCGPQNRAGCRGAGLPWCCSMRARSARTVLLVTSSGCALVPSVLSLAKEMASRFGGVNMRP